ncbi:sulfotransferase [Qipengyuania qiaonensis]|uniref:Sulfotransferase n=1 Tax=Qipengyuania qiaonensis TaxID=2867240 RepID=A0ABS7J593_9SPHN|nr:sulfotransferase [Qipengyuania qiaonensis]MBX7482498.1 sulfotransferase [Qipengyuania qiaonensis]
MWADRAVRALWETGLTPKPPVDPEYLWKIGSRGFETEDERSGRDEIEVEDFRERLAKLCVSLSEEARLNALGHTMAYGQLSSAIRTRHALGRVWRETPSLATTEIAPPIIVVGQMRAGTTRMHRLLAADPRHTGTRFCNSHYPVPAKPDLRRFKAGAALAVARQINPWLDTLHPFGATRTDEEIGWLAGALSPATFEAQWRIPSFVGWNEAHGADPVYAEFARILRTDASVMGDAARPRILKCPQFSEDLPALLRQFPDARLVVTHREGRALLDSSVSLVASQMAFQTDYADLVAIEAEWRRKLALRDERIEATLAGFDGPVARIDFDALGANWRREIAQTYDAIGIQLTAEALEAMEAEQALSANSAHLQHRLQIAQFATS